MDAAIPVANEFGRISTSTVFILDEDAHTRRTIALLAGEIQLRAEEWVSAQAFLDQYDGQRPGCLVLDIGLVGGMSGIELQRLLNARHLRPPIIFVTSLNDIPLVTKAIRDGAVDVIPKPLDRGTLVARIREAVELDLNRREKSVQLVEIRRRMDGLTAREREVMRLLAVGESVKQIAHKLAISSKTVDNHRAKVLEKMGVDNPTQLARQLALLEHVN